MLARLQAFSDGICDRAESELNARAIFDELADDIAHDLLFGLWLCDRHLRHGLVDLNEGIDLRNMQVALEAIHPRHARVDLRDNVLCRANAFGATTNVADIAVAMLVGRRHGDERHIDPVIFNKVLRTMKV